MLDWALDTFRVGGYFRRIALARALAQDLSEDLSFLRTLRRFALPLPGLDREPRLDNHVFPPPEPFHVPALQGKKIGVVATGGSGAMICAIGVMRACEEAGLDVAAISACSGSALFLAPIAAGLDAQQTADFVLGWRTEDYIDFSWRELLRIPLALGKGFTGMIRGEVVQQTLERRLGDVTVGELPVPYYANVWDLDHNRVLHMGTRATPDISLARLARVAMTLPLYVRPTEVDGMQCGDGGVVNIFPVDPLLEHHPEIDFFIGVNAFHPENFDGEDVTGWHEQTFSMLRVSNQVLQCQHLEVARQQLQRIADRCLLCHPLPHHDIRGVKFYEQFIDRSNWPRMITAGYEDARRRLEQLPA